MLWLYCLLAAGVAACCCCCCCRCCAAWPKASKIACKFRRPRLGLGLRNRLEELCVLHQGGPSAASLSSDQWQILRLEGTQSRAIRQWRRRRRPRRAGGGVRGTRAVPFDGARLKRPGRQKLAARGPCAGLVLVSSSRREERAFRASSMRARSERHGEKLHKQSSVVRSRGGGLTGLQIDGGRRNFTHARLPLADSNRNPRRSGCLDTRQRKIAAR